MFNTYNATHSVKEYVPYAKTEIRAVTDDSIRIYEEIKEKSFKSIIDTIVINDNTLNIKAIVCHEYFGYTVKFAVLLNGKDFNGSFVLDDYKIESRTDIVQHIVEHASRAVAVEITKIIMGSLKWA